MKLSITPEKRKFLLWLPLFAIPFLLLVFHILGGGGGGGKAKDAVAMGLNMQLPAAPFVPGKALQDKQKAYEQAESDSARKAQYQRQDPYRRDSAFAMPAPSVPLSVRPSDPALGLDRTPAGAVGGVPAGDRRADELLQRLARLKETLHHKPAEAQRPVSSEEPKVPQAEPAAPDPQIDRLNAMLDKVIRIQHPQEQPAALVAVSRPLAEEAGPADSNANSVMAVTSADQILTSGMTIALRLIDSIRVGGRVLPAGQMVYGSVSINSDRMLVRIGGLRDGGNLYATDWQVYDLDGLPGIHIPGLLGRDVAKQSADQGVNSLNLMTVDPSLGAQAANAGIQAAKSFLGRKVRQVRVTVRAGYTVLLRSMREKDRPGKPVSGGRTAGDSVAREPDFMPTGGILERCRNEGVELRLRCLLVQDGLVWFGLEWVNRSPMPYRPVYARWTIRDRRAFRRTALQELALTPIRASALPCVAGDSVYHSWAGFPAFAMAKEKELVLEVGEQGGGRVLKLTISSHELLKAKTYAKESGGAEDGAADDPLH